MLSQPPPDLMDALEAQQQHATSPLNVPSSSKGEQFDAPLSNIGNANSIVGSSRRPVAPQDGSSTCDNRRPVDEERWMYMAPELLLHGRWCHDKFWNK
jgi:hypothetical protein